MEPRTPMLAALLASLSSGGCGGRPATSAAPRSPPVASLHWMPLVLQAKASDGRNHATEAPPVVQPEARAAATATVSPPDPPTIETARPRSTLLRKGFHNPMPGGVFAGYQADTGLDIAGSPRPVFALAAGTLDYSEPGHTLWTGPADTANCIRFELDTPIPYGDHLVTHVYYAHLSRLETLQHEGDGHRRHVEAGEMLGLSGVARHSPHLHIGFLLDGDVTQYWGTFLRADAIRDVLGGYRNGDCLPSTTDTARDSGDPVAAVSQRDSLGAKVPPPFR